MVLNLSHLATIIYRMARNFGKVFNLAIWVKIAKLKTRKFGLNVCVP